MTLFYWDLSNPPLKKFKHSVESWAKSISANTKQASPATQSQANSRRSGKSNSGRSIPNIPSVTDATCHSTCISVLTDAVAVTRTQAAPAQIKPDANSIIICNQGLSDHDELNSYEHDIAVTSPVKGRKRLNSEVSGFFSA